MRLISCNIWGGVLFDAIEQFVRAHNGTTDIFCFQEVFYTPANYHNSNEEVRTNLLNELTLLLHDYYVWFAPKLDNNDHFVRDKLRSQFGNVMFIKHDLLVEEYGVAMLVGHPRNEKTWSVDSQNRNAQYALLTDPKTGKQFAVINTHGYWKAGEKTDSPESLEQSKRLLALTERLDAPTILCGDFNLRPSTKSIQSLSGPYSNLIAEHNITNTRTSHYKKTAETFADYTFTKDIVVDAFAVPAEPEISDHRFMQLDFSL